MSEQITDTEGAELLFVNLNLGPSEESSIVVALIPAAVGKYLAGPADAHARVYARRTGSGAPFVELSASPIALAPWAGSVVSFDFKVSTLPLASGHVRAALPVRVTFRP